MEPTTCHFCPASQPRMISGNHWADNAYVRVGICNDCFAACKLAKAPRRPRQPRATTMPATDWNYLVAFAAGRKSGNR